MELHDRPMPIQAQPDQGEPVRCGVSELAPADAYDPVLEAYKKGVDRSLLIENLRLTPAQRAHAEHTQRTYAFLLHKFVGWAESQSLNEWKAVEPRHLMQFLQHERERNLNQEPKDSSRRLSSESVYLEIAALRAFYRFAENE